MKIIPPKVITDAMLLACTLAEPDPATNETAWSATEICAAGDQRFIGSPTSTVTITIATPAVFTWAANGLALDTPIVFSTTGALPTGIVAGTTYYVRTRLTANTFTVSDAIGGRAITTSGSQSGTHTAVAKVHRIYEAAIGQKATVTADSTADTITYTAHGLTADTRVVFTTTGTLPSPLVAGTTYYVKNPTTDTFQLAAAAGGAAINMTTTGTGVQTCGLAVNYNQPPAIGTADYLDPAVWVDAGPTNKWAPFDESLTTGAQANGELTYFLQPGRFNSIGFKGVNAASLYVDFQINLAAVTITVATPAVVTYNAHGFVADTPILLSTTGALPTGLSTRTTYYVRNPTTNTFELSATAGGASIATTGAGSGTHTCGKQVYQNTVDLNSGVKAGSWYAWFNMKRVQQEAVAEIDVLDAALFDLPAYTAGVLTISLLRSGGTVSVAAIVVGKSFTVGDTLPGPEVAVLDFSKKQADDFGNVYVSVRPYSDRQTIYARVPQASVDSVVSFLKAYRARPLFVVADESNTYSALLTYGFIADWSMPIAPKEAPLYSTLTARLEGLTAD
jgi:hypothetical protein